MVHSSLTWISSRASVAKETEAHHCIRHRRYGGPGKAATGPRGSSQARSRTNCLPHWTRCPSLLTSPVGLKEADRGRSITRRHCSDDARWSTQRDYLAGKWENRPPGSQGSRPTLQPAYKRMLLRELRPIRPSAAHFLGVNLGRTRGMELRILTGQGLAIGADPRIAVNRHFGPLLLAATYALKNHHEIKVNIFMHNF